MHLGYALTSTFSKIPIELLVMEENLHRNICLRGKSHQIGTFFKKKKKKKELFGLQLLSWRYFRN